MPKKKRSHCPKTPRLDHDQSSAPPPDYEIGYGRPPLHTRFKPGRSGNLRGRPKRHRNLRTVVEEALSQTIKIREGDRTRSLSTLEALVASMLNKALKGDAKTQTVVIGLLRSVGITAEPPEPASAESVTANDADIIADFFRRQGASTQNAAAPEDAADNRQNTAPKKGTKP
jgi:hypothetical protein